MKTKGTEQKQMIDLVRVQHDPIRLDVNYFTGLELAELVGYHGANFGCNLTVVRLWQSIDRVLGLTHHPCLENRIHGCKWSVEARRSPNPASTRRNLSLLHAEGVKSISVSPELCG